MMLRAFHLSILAGCVLLHVQAHENASSAQTTTLPNPILFAAQIPIPSDTGTITTVFGNHLATTKSCGRGGDLCILYPDGTLKNLTGSAGYGMFGQQGANAIAVREPSMHWSGTKAVFSMVVGAPASQSDTTHFFWQLYEVTGLGELETPVITKVANQPASYNNTNPIYGTDDRIIFSSDRPHNGMAHLYPQLDEYRGELTNSGLWSLDPVSGDLYQLDHAPSGDFRPFLDSYGRVIFSRWDHLQRDSQADKDILQGNTSGSFNYSDESSGAAVLQNDRTEYYPEPQSSRTDLLAGTNINGFEFNHFFPWQINEDGSEGETINHVGRHDLNVGFGHSFNDDPNLVNFPITPVRTNTNPIANMFQVVEDPTTPGRYYGVDCIENGTHGAGQIITLAGAPTLDAQDMFVTYVTNRVTSFFLPENGTPNANYTGHYRNPLPLSNGQLLTVHSDENRVDMNTGTFSDPVSRYAFRIKTMKVQSGSILMADQPVTTGISKAVSYWTDAGLVSFSGTLWELDPVEVKSRTKPVRRIPHVGTPEMQVMNEEGVDSTVLQNYLKSRNLAIIVSRNITNRNTDDRQQPFYLKVHNSQTQSPNPTGKVYDVNYLQLFEADHLRGYGLVNGNPPSPGRRVLPQPLNDPTAMNPPNPAGPAGSVKLGTDGSMAAIIPAHRAMAWQLTDTAGTPVVRERFWVTFQPGEVRTCASCHGSNGEAAVPKQIIPQNKPEALRSLLRFMKGNLYTAAVPALLTPVDAAINQSTLPTLGWNSSTLATSYRVQVSTDSIFSTPIVDDSTVTDTNKSILPLATGTTYFWRVRALDGAGASSWSTVWRFTTHTAGPNQVAVVGAWNLISLPVIPDDARKTFLFPSATSNAFAFVGSYQTRDSLFPGTGYWMEFSGDEIISLSGTLLSSDTIPVVDGWNLTGALGMPFSVLSIGSVPPGLVTSNFFAYAGGTYAVADSLRPGNGYWVRVNGSGHLVLSSSASATSSSRIKIALLNETPPAPPSTDANGRHASHVPHEFALGQNYPNPFNPATTFAFQIADAGLVSLKVFDVLGREVETIVNGELAPGTYTRVWNAGDLPSGIYTYRLVTKSFTSTRKMLLLK